MARGRLPRVGGRAPVILEQRQRALADGTATTPSAPHALASEAIDFCDSRGPTNLADAVISQAFLPGVSESFNSSGAIPSRMSDGAVVVRNPTRVQQPSASMISIARSAPSAV